MDIAKIPLAPFTRGNTVFSRLYGKVSSIGSVTLIVNHPEKRRQKLILLANL